MNSEEFKKAGREVIDYLADYRDSISKRLILPNVEPGFMADNIPLAPPKVGEKWENIMQDIEKCIMPGITHWIHPQFHSYFPLGDSHPAILGDMLSSAISCSGSSWSNSPSSTELDIIVIDWIGSMLGLPDKFLFYKSGHEGGGGFQGSSSECILMTLFAAQRNSLEKLQKQNPSEDEGTLLSLLTAYCSKQAHSSVEKACLLALVDLRTLDTDEKFQLRGKILEEAIENDIKNGYSPFFVVATFGTTSCASCDKLDEIGPICKKYDLWLHVDGAYGASALICPEFRPLVDGLEYASSLNLSPYKWLLSNLDCAIIWLDNRLRFIKALSVDPLSIWIDPKSSITDFCHWGMADSRRFRSLQVWSMLRTYGAEGLRNHIRNHVRLAKYFEELVRGDDRFEVVTVNFGLVCFRLKKSNQASKQLLATITASKKIFLIPTVLKGKYVIRFCVNVENASEIDVNYAWKVISRMTDVIEIAPKSNLKVQDTKEPSQI